MIHPIFGAMHSNLVWITFLLLYCFPFWTCWSLKKRTTHPYLPRDWGGGTCLFQFAESLDSTVFEKLGQCSFNTFSVNNRYKTCKPSFIEKEKGFMLKTSYHPVRWYERESSITFIIMFVAGFETIWLEGCEKNEN